MRFTTPSSLYCIISSASRLKEGTLQRTRDRRRTTYHALSLLFHYAFAVVIVRFRLGKLRMPRRSYAVAFKKMCNPSTLEDEEILESPLPCCTIDTALEIPWPNCRKSAPQATRSWSPAFLPTRYSAAASTLISQTYSSLQE